MNYLNLALFELFWFCLIVATQFVVQKASGGAVRNFLDEGPWWSRAVHMVWMACHIGALLLQVLVKNLHNRYRPDKTIPLSGPLYIFLFNAANGVLILALDALTARTG